MMFLFWFFVVYFWIMLGLGLGVLIDHDQGLDNAPDSLWFVFYPIFHGIRVYRELFPDG